MHAILSALGRDRVGVADDLATALANWRIDIEHSRMTALRGRFALIVQLCGEEANVTTLRRELDTLGASLGFHLELEAIRPQKPPAKEPRFLLESFSRGASGLNAVTSLLKKHGINIEDLETEAFAAPWTSAITLHTKARLTIPPSCSLTNLREELRELERERALEILLQPIPDAAAEQLEPATVT